MDNRLIKQAEQLLKDMEADQKSNLNDMGKEENKYTDLAIHAMKVSIERMETANKYGDEGK